MRPITKRQQDILNFIKAEVEKRGYPPSVREIGEAVGLASTSSVHKQLNQLEQKGLIRKDKSTTRGLALLLEEEANLTQPEEKHAVVNVPLIGDVTAGNPIEAIQNPNEFFPLPSYLVPTRGNVFMLSVKGDSMINAGIFDGDYIIVNQQATAINGDIVVAMLGETFEVTVKRLFKESDHIRLQPENDSLEPIITKSAQVIGKVVGLFRVMV